MPDNYNLSPNDRKVQEIYAGSSRDLVFLQISVSCTTDSLDTNYTDSNSNFAKLIQVLQQRLELFGVGEPSGNEVTVIASRATIPYAEGEEADAGGTVQALEDMIDASPDFSSANVYQGQLSGWSIENDC